LLLLCFILGTLWGLGDGQIRYSVPEETDRGFFVGNISKDLGLEPQELAERGVRIVSGEKTQLFALNPRGGSLVTAGRVDREELCETVSSCFLSMEILVEDTLKIYGVEVEIIDVNDNAPTFREEEVEIKVSEHATPGSRFPLPNARDPDVGANSLQSYQLSPNSYRNPRRQLGHRGQGRPGGALEHATPGSRFPLPNARDPDVGANSLQSYQLSPNSYFSLQVRGGADGVKNPELVLEGGLDREKAAAHHLLLTAADGGDPIRKGTIPIRAVVLDVNDHIPKFTQPVYQVSVPENLSSGTRVLVVNATDPDEGTNGEVMYSFRNMESKASEIFQMNSKTGEVLVQGPLDFEKYKFYEMEIQGQDGGGLLTTAKMLITVVDVNDNAPEITITSSVNSLLENSPPGSVIALLNVRDRDSGENGQVSCFIPNNLPFKLEKTYGNYYKLITNSELDREQIQSYNVTLTAKDQGSPPLYTEAHLLLNVADDNDNPPVFSQSSYSAYIPENNPRGASIFSVTAVDLDSKENAHVTYSLMEDTIQGVPLSSYVSINSDTGILYSLQSFDYEQFQNLQLRVAALDGGDPVLTGTAQIKIKVTDANDNPPVFTQNVYKVSLRENVPPGTSMLQVTAIDQDEGANAEITYSFKTLLSYVSVSAQSGVVFAQRAFDHEQLRAFELTLQARDQGSPALSANVSLRVLVGDRNDNAPRVLYPALGPDGSALFDTVPRAAEPGYLVTKVVAVDADSGHNAWLSYHVLQASDPGLFSLGLRTGEVRTARALGDKDAARHRLLVAVRDGGKPPLSATATLLLVFAD
ncbi:Protocadherin gamma-A11, partial [Heterocephalus glaber]